MENKEDYPKKVYVMVVDDEEDVKFLFEQKFRKDIKQELMRFYFAYSGEQALEMLHSSEIPDVVLILSDINMPGMNGIDLLRNIKGELPGMKVVMVTAYGDEDNYNRAMDCGANGFVNKPIDFEELRKIICGMTNDGSAIQE